VKILVFKFYNFVVNFVSSQFSNIRSCFKYVFRDSWWSVRTDKIWSIIEQHNKGLLCVSREVNIAIVNPWKIQINMS